MVGTNEDAWNKRIEASDGDMSDWDRSMVPKSARLTIPLRHSRQLRKAAETLKMLANRLENLSRRNDMTERTILHEAWWNVRIADGLINPDASNVVSLPKK